MVGVGRDLCGSSSPTPLPKQGHLLTTFGYPYSGWAPFYPTGFLIYLDRPAQEISEWAHNSAVQAEGMRLKVRDKFADVVCRHDMLFLLKVIVFLNEWNYNILVLLTIVPLCPSPAHIDYCEINWKKGKAVCLFCLLHIVVGWPWLDARCPPKLRSLPFSDGQGRENITKGSWVDIRTGRSLTSYRHGQNRLDLVKLVKCIANQIRAG